MIEGFKVLIVEDAIASARAIQDLFTTEFPTSRFDLASSRHEAESRLNRMVETRESYDLAIVDLELPQNLAGSVEEYQTSFDEDFIDKFWNGRESTVAFLMTAHSEDNERVKSYFQAMDRLKDPRFRKYPKIEGYTYEMLREAVSCLQGGRILALIDGMFGDENRAIPMSSGLTTRLAEIQANIQLYWNDLRTEMRESIRSRLEVDDTVSPPIIRLK